jgi:MoaA/NifB/PqqE/SkfB family radical SAM enzyme
MCLGCQYHFERIKLKTVDDTVQDISMELVQKIVKELPILGTERVILAGPGEPLLHPQFPEIIAAFKRAGLEVHFITNGLLLDKERSLALIESGLDRLIVSLWATSLETYVQCHPGTNPEYYWKIVENIRQFSSMKEEIGIDVPDLFLNHVCNIYTYKNVNEKIELAYDLGCNGILFSPFNPLSDRAKSAALSEEQVDFLLKQFPLAAKRMVDLGIKYHLNPIFLRKQLHQDRALEMPCYIGRMQTRIRIDGAVMPCCYCNMLMGNLNKKSLKDIWNDKPYKDFRKRSENIEDLATLMYTCACDWCCYVGQNSRVHRIFKWLPPFRR